MTPATHAAFDTQSEVDLHTSSERTRAQRQSGTPDIRLSIEADLSAIESEWRAFERHADCTVFQAFDWVSVWQRHVGARKGAVPVVVTGRDSAGGLMFLLPLAIEKFGPARRLIWLGSELCDYNAPLLAADFSCRIDQENFLRLWSEIAGRLQSHPDFQHDFVHFEKMPEKVGAQANPMLGLPVMRNASNAYMTQLGGDWETFYTAKRSSSTRRRDRTKRKKLGEFGEVKFVDPAGVEDVSDSFDTLMSQKSKQFAAMGVPDIFARPGYPEFFREMATTKRDIVHVSRLDVGAVPAALNLGLTFRGCYYHVLASYTDAELSKYGPGAAHLHELMGYAIKRGCGAFDFTIGDERYKRDWCDTELKLFDHVTFATVRGAAVARPLQAARIAKRWIKQTPAVWNAVTKMRALAGSLRGKPAAEKSAD